MTDPEQLLNYTKAAQALSVSRATLYRLIDAGDLTPVKLPRGGPRIRRTDLERIMGGAPTGSDTPSK